MKIPTPEETARCYDMWKSGMNIPRIARATGITRDDVRSYIQLEKIKRERVGKNSQYPKHYTSSGVVFG